MSHVPNTGIEELYRSVIQEVIEQSKEACLDENIDTEILVHLQKVWEDKINASGAADLNKEDLAVVPQVRPSQPKPQSSTANTNRPGPSIGRNTAPTMVTQESPSTSSIIQGQSQNLDLSMFTNPSGGAIQIQGLPYLPNNMGQFVVAGNPGQNVMLLPMHMTGNSYGGQNVIHMTPEQIKQLPQNDGECFIPDMENAEISLDLKAGTLTIDTSNAKNKEEVDKKKTEAAIEVMKNLKMDSKRSKKQTRIVNLAMVIPQVDGGPHMSDSSSDEEDEDDPLSRMVNRIDDKGEDEGDDEGGDEDPLNSDDDQSDDEDLETLFESSNIIVCQFEKVNRARNKWKFTLKDGIMHLNGKDYCFQKCTGEAEW